MNFKIDNGHPKLQPGQLWDRHGYLFLSVIDPERAIPMLINVKGFSVAHRPATAYLSSDEFRYVGKLKGL